MKIIPALSTAWSELTLRKRGLSKRRLGETFTFWAFVAPNLILFGVFTFWPLIYSFALGFTKWNMIAPTKDFVGLSNYQKMVNDPVFWQVLRNTFAIAASSFFIKMPIALVLAAILNQRMAARQLYRAIIFSPTFTTNVAIAMVWTWIFDPYYGLLRVPLNMLGLSSPHWLYDVHWSLPAVIIVFIWRDIGWDMVIFLAGLQGIPAELYEAARVDGASVWSLFRHITLPLLSPTTFFLMVISIINAMKAFAIPQIMTEGGPLNSSNVYLLYLYENAFDWFRVGYASALAVVLFVIILMITFAQNRLSRRWVHYQ